MPILNEERHLEEAVATVLDQDYLGAIELILALGPSRDRTDEIAVRSPPVNHACALYRALPGAPPTRSTRCSQLIAARSSSVSTVMGCSTGTMCGPPKLCLLYTSD